MTNYAPCPKCHNAGAERLKFTWWGGILGPKLLTHVKCQSCGHKYNGKSGRDNTTNIVIYFVVVGVICIGLVVVIVAAAALMAMSR